jgi:hypothetical protein
MFAVDAYGAVTEIMQMEPQYIIRVYDINGRAHTTEDEESAARDWLWSCLKRLTEDGTQLPYGYKPQVEFVKVS